MTGIDLAWFAGLSALVAAAMTVVGAITLLVFFQRGGLWGAWNDASSVVLMLAMVPIAVVLAILELEVVTTTALVIGAIGIAAMLAFATLQALLVARRVTYDQTKGAINALGAVIGAWYLLTAASTGQTAVPDGMRLAAAVAGVGFIAVGLGFARGGQSHPLAAIGGAALFIASIVFFVWLGVLLLGGGLVIPGWNA